MTYSRFGIGGVAADEADELSAVTEVVMAFGAEVAAGVAMSTRQ